MVVLLPRVGAQTIVTLPPLSSCAKGVFVDFDAKAKINTDKKTITISGKLFSGNDTMKKLKPKVFLSKSQPREVIFSSLCHVNIIRLKTDEKNVTLFPTGTILNNKEFSIELFIPSFNKENQEEVEIDYYFEFANGCSYVLKQKIR